MEPLLDNIKLLYQNQNDEINSLKEEIIKMKKEEEYGTNVILKQDTLLSKLRDEISSNLMSYQNNCIQMENNFKLEKNKIEDEYKIKINKLNNKNKKLTEKIEELENKLYNLENNGTINNSLEDKKKICKKTRLVKNDISKDKIITNN